MKFSSRGAARIRMPAIRETSGVRAILMFMEVFFLLERQRNQGGDERMIEVRYAFAGLRPALTDRFAKPTQHPRFSMFASTHRFYVLQRTDCLRSPWSDAVCLVPRNGSFKCVEMPAWLRTV